MIRVGKIVATQGLEGSLVLSHIVGKSDWLKDGAVLFLELNKESYIPFFTSKLRVVSDEEYVIQLEDVEQVEQAKKLVGKKVYVQEDIIFAHAQESPLLWIGFNIVDKEKGGLGAIEDVMLTGSQWLAKITYQGKEVLIPLIDQMIIEVNIRNKYIRMDLPEGLIEVYL